MAGRCACEAPGGESRLIQSSRFCYHPLSMASETDNVLLRLPPKLGEQIRKEAETTRRPLNSQIVVAIEHYLARKKK